MLVPSSRATRAGFFGSRDTLTGFHGDLPSRGGQFFKPQSRALLPLAHFTGRVSAFRYDWPLTHPGPRLFARLPPTRPNPWRIPFIRSRVFPDEVGMLDAAFTLAAEISAKSPVAVQGTKINLVYSRNHPVAEGLNYAVRLCDQPIIALLWSQNGQSGPSNPPQALPSDWCAAVSSLLFIGPIPVFPHPCHGPPPSSSRPPGI